MTADHMDAPDTIPVAPAEAATDIGADDYDGAVPEGAAIVTALAAACALALIAAALGAAAAAFF